MRQYRNVFLGLPNLGHNILVVLGILECRISGRFGKIVGIFERSCTRRWVKKGVPKTIIAIMKDYIETINQILYNFYTIFFNLKAIDLNNNLMMSNSPAPMTDLHYVNANLFSTCSCKITRFSSFKLDLNVQNSFLRFDHRIDSISSSN